MMRNLLLLACFLASASALAMDWKSDITLSPQPMEYSGPADSVMPGDIIGSTWSATANVEEVFWCGLVWTCSKGTLEPSPSAISSGMTVTVDGQNYTIFETGIPGIGYIIGLKDFNGSEYVPLQTGITQSYPASGTSGYATKLGWSAKVTFIKTGTALKSGLYTTPTIQAAILTAYNNETKTAQVIINPTTITVAASGCTVNTKSANVDLGTLDIRTLSTVGSTSPSGTFNVTLTCDQNIAVNAVMTDQTTPSNSSSVVTLTGDSTASGVGVQFFYNGIGPLSMGPDSTADGTLNQFFIQTTSSANQVLSLPFQAQYIRTGDLVPGTANALASITFSYQ
ncbi:fimbrial protein [Pantoea agglomerans]|uniref:fimbrial protein n=1 Tax=Enterobacter agglomerans TaxID=549 RepID=UPI00083D9D79|nr:fimbrial protein [Pantoea agglomerans]AOE39896.1 oxidoreductase [Pantoea agglomerans]MBE5683519.1 fimbrial protein [Pantoea agglomerans]MDH1169317.1 fimbrial protein [Pantoea agglomerans]NEG67161.1 oxidoreductase [Pantoea agglomerans]WNK66657.1 fimbrial protein [Pantoea agglomerans]